MKANEMPERIYLFDYNDAMVTPLEGDTVYVREDAFIEKAENVLEMLDDILSFIDTLEVKELDLEKIKRDWRNKGYIEGRKQALIPARKLGLPKSLNIIDIEEVKVAAKAWSEDDENTGSCDYIGAAVAERAFVACAEWLINKAQKGE